jgi:sugar transferase (PEP-CTERM/EpsH1 system associated)
LSLDVGGLERNVVNQVKEGDALGQRVSVICLERLGVLADRVEALGGQVICLDKRPGIRFSLIRRMRAVLRDLEPDIVHTHQIPTLFYAGPAAQLLVRTRVVHTEHGLPLVASRAKTRWLARWSALHCDLFFCLTQEMAVELKRQRIVPDRKLRVIKNGIETAHYRSSVDPTVVRLSLGVSPSAPLIGTVGRLVEIKQQDLLIRAFAEVRRRCPDAHLVLVGDGPERPVLERLCDQLRIGPSVHFAGYQPNVAEYLHAMTCFALTSRSEGTPQAVLEASMAGLPVVATRVGGLPEVVEDGRTGLLFSPGDKEALARALLQLIEDRPLARSLGEAARQHVESTYGIGRMAREYHKCFLSLSANYA